jgi:hypothetical protein
MMSKTAVTQTPKALPSLSDVQQGDENSGNLFLISFEEGTKVQMLGEDGKPVPKPKAEWFEFNATFDHGTLTLLERLEEV